jgi:hypothetical protein
MQRKALFERVCFSVCLLQLVVTQHLVLGNAVQLTVVPVFSSKMPRLGSDSARVVQLCLCMESHVPYFHFIVAWWLLFLHILPLGGVVRLVQLFLWVCAVQHELTGCRAVHGYSNFLLTAFESV